MDRVKSVFVVQHSYEQADQSDEVKFIGVYSTEVAARAAIEVLRRQPGFADFPEEFFVDEYRLDETQWTEGFVTE